MTDYLLLIVWAVFINNVVLVQILGLCPFMGVSKKLEASVGMGAATTFVLTIATGASNLINKYLLGPDLAYLQALSFIVVIAGLVQLTEMVMKKTFPPLYQTLGIYLPLITTNCAVLGVPLLTVTYNHNFIQSLLFGFGSSLGFSMALAMFAGIRERLDGADVPGIFKGSAIAMITGGLMSLSFMGFAGLIKL